MNEQQKRLLQIADDVLQWNLEWLDFLRRISEVEAMGDISEADKKEILAASQRIANQFEKVVELSDPQPTAHDLIEQLIASHDRLREELSSANKKLDGILASRRPR